MRSIKVLPLNTATPSLERGPVPEMRWLPIAELRVDPIYQRSITMQGEKNVRAIVTRFDWRMFAPVVVCPVEGGFYAIVDGQHRTTAAAMCGIESVPCLIIQADRQMQARSFTAINSRVTRVDATTIYKAKLAAGDADALRIKSVGEQANVRVLTYHPSADLIRPRETFALVCLQRVLASKEEWIVAVALAAAAEAAGDRKGLLGALTINAFVAVLDDHREWCAKQSLPDVSRQFDLLKAIGDVTAQAALKRMSKAPLLEATIITHYAEAYDV